MICVVLAVLQVYNMHYSKASVRLLQNIPITTDIRVWYKRNSMTLTVLSSAMVVQWRELIAASTGSIEH
jgi:hypothetical protein